MELTRFRGDFQTAAEASAHLEQEAGDDASDAPAKLTRGLGIPSRNLTAF